MTQIQLICLIYILISGFAALQRAIVMMQVPGQSLPVSVSVFICILTFELQPESSACMFHVSGFFCIMVYGVNETAMLENARHNLVLLTTYCVI